MRTALLGDDEVVAVVETVVAACGARVPVIAHVGRPATQVTIALGERALVAGAAAVSAVVPYYHALGADQVTGLGLKLSSLIVDAAGGSLWLTALFSAVAVLVVGLAVPVTASFIIAAVIIAPALISLGVEDFAAYMFIFYYAVLSEVSPPTALCRYTAPAFLVPFAFVLSPNGEGLLLQGDAGTIALAVAVSALAVAALGVALGGWLRGRVAVPARVLAGAAALILLYLDPLWIAVGLGVLALAIVAHVATRTTPPAAGASGGGGA